MYFSPLDETKHLKKLYDAEKVYIHKEAYEEMKKEAIKSLNENRERSFVLNGWYDENTKTIYLTSIIKHDELDRENYIPQRGRNYVINYSWWKIVEFREREGLKKIEPIATGHTHTSGYPIKERFGGDKASVAVRKIKEVIIQMKNDNDMEIEILLSRQKTFLSEIETKFLPCIIEMFLE